MARDASGARFVTPAPRRARVPLPELIRPLPPRADVDLLATRLLARWLGHDETDHWSRFFQTYLPDAVPRNGPSFNNADLIIRSAIAHHGVAIVREVLASDALGQGQLVQPWPHSLPCEDAYHLLHKRSSTDSSKINDLRDWLQQELALSVSQVRAGKTVIRGNDSL